MLSNATSTAWSTAPRTRTCLSTTASRKRGCPGRRRGAGSSTNKKGDVATRQRPRIQPCEGTDENQTDKRVRRRPGESPALLYRGTGLREEERLQQRAVSLANRGFARGAGRHRAAAGAQ